MQANRIQQSFFKNLVTKIASANIGHCVLAVLFVGLVFAMSGVLIECNYQADLLAQSDNALQTYQLALHAQAIDSVFVYLLKGIQLQLPSAGGNLQAIGLGICYFLAPFVAAVLFALRILGFKPQLTRWEMSLA
jgi:hypothetical protein